MTLNYDCSRSFKVKGHCANRKPMMVSYLTSVVSNIASLMEFEIFDAEVL